MGDNPLAPGRPDVLPAAHGPAWLIPGYRANPAPAERYLGVVARLDGCGPRGEDFAGLLAAVRGEHS